MSDSDRSLRAQLRELKKENEEEKRKREEERRLREKEGRKREKEGRRLKNALILAGIGKLKIRQGQQAPQKVNL